MQRTYSTYEKMIGLDPSLYCRDKFTPIFHQVIKDGFRYTFKRRSDGETSFGKELVVHSGEDTTHQWIFEMFGFDRCEEAFKAVTGQSALVYSA